ncbi:MAG: GGDEF domain-containing protein [Bauldia sp.]|nr:GGDEF domain-containing protein [Bauldia sp.]
MIDPSTMFLALIASTVASVLLLLWCYWLNRSEQSLLWVAACFALGSASTVLIALRGSIPGWLSIDVGVALLLFGTGLTWVAVRVFNGHRATFAVPAIGPILWLVACQVPAFGGDATMRIVAGSAITALYWLVAAREMVSRDDLATRMAIAVVMCVHSGLILLRIPVIFFEATPDGATFDGRWFGPAALESAVFIQIIAFLMVSLVKERVEAELRSAALTDALTGLGNRRAFFEASAKTFAQNARKNRPTTVIVFDLDRFKEVNDRFGHPIGDAVIRLFAEAAANRLRAGDVIGRLGGEEFAVTLPETTGPQATLVAEQLIGVFAASVAALAIPDLICSASAGVAETTTSAETLEDVLGFADKALYEAKALGGGRVAASPVKFLPRPEVQAAAQAA